jgi:hypothetical protein
MFLRCSVQSTLKQWVKWLPLAELWYNTSYHSALQCTPFKALYGVDPHPGFCPPLHQADNQDIAELFKERQMFTELLKEQLARAQNRMKFFADHNRIECSFQVGDLVLLKLQPYAQSSVVNRPFPKLAFKYYGPFAVLEKLGSCAYKLQLPNNSLIHPVFHVSQLKAFTPDHAPVYSFLPEIPVLDIKEVLPAKILDRRLVKKGSAAVVQILVQWSGLPESSSTWEDYHVLKNRFPAAPVWSQPGSSAGGDVITQEPASTNT